LVEITRKKLSSIVLSAIVISSILSLEIYTYATSPSTTPTFSSGPYPGAPTYTIYTNGSWYYAKNAYGAVDYSGTDATQVVQNVFDNHPAKVLFKAGTYNLFDHAVTAYVPIIIEGEGKQTIIYRGTLTVWSSSNLGHWLDNTNIVRNLRFNTTNPMTQLRYVNVSNGEIYGNSFWSDTFALSTPQIALTDSLSIRVYDNWFDGETCQIIRINGSYASQPLHMIFHNDFGSMNAGTFPTPTHRWEIAAIYIEGGNNEGINIHDNLAFLRSDQTFVYSEAPHTLIVKNQIYCANYHNYYAIELQHYYNIVADNEIDLGANGGGIAIWQPLNLSNPMYFNTIVNNQFIGPANASSPAIYGILLFSVISGNIFHTNYGIELHNTALTNVNDNNFNSFSSPSDRFAFKETGNSGKNILSNIWAYGTYIYMLTSNATSNSRVTNSWNNTVWIERYGYGS